jgi:hypothetical protein
VLVVAPVVAAVEELAAVVAVAGDVDEVELELEEPHPTATAASTTVRTAVSVRIGPPWSCCLILHGQ